MEKGLIVFSHKDMHDYFKEAFKNAVEKVGDQFGISILQWQDGEASFFHYDLGLAPQVSLRVGTLNCKYPYLHSLMQGIADYFQQSVQDCTCIYKMID